MASLFDLVRNRDGNFAVYLAVAAVPLLIAAGLAMDYTTVTRVDRELQAALDTAALSVAREGIKMDDAKAKAIAEQFVAANFNGVVNSVTVNRSGVAVSIGATVPPNLAFSGLLGNDSWQVSAISKAEYAPAKFEIALALDQTGSMEGAKLAAMKDAVNTMVDAMSVQVSDPAALKIGIVPYATFVNVGPQYGPSFDSKGRQIKGTGAKWLDVEGVSPIPQVELPFGVSRFQIYQNLGKTWPGCVETRPAVGLNDYDVTDADAHSSIPSSLFVPAFNIDEPDSILYPNHYIVSDVSPMDKTAPGLVKKSNKYGIPVNASGDPIASGTWTPIPIDDSLSYFYSNEADPKGPGYGCEIEPILPLTNNIAAIKAKVNAIQANGSTNITEGVMWGWRVLSDRAPFQEGSAKAKKARKILILLTDGTNSFGNLPNDLGSGYSSTGYLVDERLDGTDIGSTVSDTTAAMNAKTLASCTNAKADGIEIFTIRLEEPNVATGTLLADCATDADHFFDSPSKDDLKPIFEKIRDQLTVVRLAS